MARATVTHTSEDSVKAKLLSKVGVSEENLLEHDKATVTCRGAQVQVTRAEWCCSSRRGPGGGSPACAIGRREEITNLA
jgi:hypothetical protein